MQYRLIHTATEIVAIVEDVGVTGTPHTVFTGAAAQCRAEAERLGLADPNGALDVLPAVPEQTTGALISGLHAAFTAVLPPEAQVAFAAPYAIVRTLVLADQMQLAAAYIAGIPVPPDLEAAKAMLVAMILPTPSPPPTA